MMVAAAPWTWLTRRAIRSARSCVPPAGVFRPYLAADCQVTLVIDTNQEPLGRLSTHRELTIMHAYVRDIMTTRVVAVSPATSYRKMTGMLREHRVSGFPVVDDGGKVIGVVSEADLLAKEVDADPGGHQDWPARLPHRRPAKVSGLTAADLMTRPAVTTGPDELVSVVARLMRAHRLKRLPVVEHDGHLVGIVSRADVLSVFNRTDEEIRREVTQDIIMDGFFTDPARLEVTVQDGIVTLAGAPGSIILGNNIADQVRHVEGVVAVRDRFTYPRSSLGSQEKGRP